MSMSREKVKLCIHYGGWISSGFWLCHDFDCKHYNTKFDPAIHFIPSQRKSPEQDRNGQRQ